jgi:hypothetical protein
MKMNKKDIIVAGCGAFSVIVLAINWLVPSSAQTLPTDEVIGDANNAFTIWNGANGNLAKRVDTLAATYRELKAENARLKDELAKAKAPAPPATPAVPPHDHTH